MIGVGFRLSDFRFRLFNCELVNCELVINFFLRKIRNPIAEIRKTEIQNPIAKIRKPKTEIRRPKIRNPESNIPNQKNCPLTDIHHFFIMRKFAV